MKLQLDQYNLPLWIGRETFDIENQEVSRKHCKIDWRSPAIHSEQDEEPAQPKKDDELGVIVVTDVSRNGTWLNGKKLQKNWEYEIHPGDLLVLGRSPKSGAGFEIVIASSKE